MDLNQLVKRLKSYADPYIAYQAYPVDNVGLLVEPSGQLEVKRALITNDLTENVLNEALELNVNMIIAYHPAIIEPMKRLTQSNWTQRIIIKCIENRIAIYSPHTTWDSISGFVFIYIHLNLFFVFLYDYFINYTRRN